MKKFICNCHNKKFKTKSSLQSHLWRQKNHEKVKLYAYNYHIKNREKINKKHRELYNLNIKKRREKNRKNKKKWYKKNIDKVRQYYQDNKEYFQKQHKIYNKLHKKEKNKWERNKYKIDVHFKLKKRLSGRIYTALRKNQKSKKTMQLIGCSIEFLKQHLAKQFTKGMTWDNHGNGWNGKKEWHIDHIIPCDAFDLSKPSEQRKCFHYTNLQPLWAPDNLKKGNKNDKSI